MSYVVLKQFFPSEAEVYTVQTREYQTYYLTLAQIKELEEVLNPASRLATRGRSIADQHKLVDEIWVRIAKLHNCDFQTIVPTEPPSSLAFKAVPLARSASSR